MVSIHRTVTRESPATMFSQGRARAIVIELAPPGAVIGFRLKGTRTTYHLPVDWCYREALKAAIAHQRAERRAARKVSK